MAKQPLTVDDVREVVNYALDSRARLSKNGETWKSYFLRLITIDRIGLAVVLIYQLGGSVQDAQRAITLAATTAAIASQKAEEASTKTIATARLMEEARQQIDQTHEQVAGLIEGQQRQAERQAELKDRVAQSLTRAEFASALAQQILPRLNRLEQWWLGQGK